MFGAIGLHVRNLVMMSFCPIFLLYSTQICLINGYITLKDVSFTTQNFCPFVRWQQCTGYHASIVRDLTFTDIRHAVFRKACQF